LPSSELLAADSPQPHPQLDPVIAWHNIQRRNFPGVLHNTFRQAETNRSA
jgi:hypothetical protein